MINEGKIYWNSIRKSKVLKRNTVLKRIKNGYFEVTEGNIFFSGYVIGIEYHEPKKNEGHMAPNIMIVFKD